MKGSTQDYAGLFTEKTLLVVKQFLVIIQFRYLYMLSIRQNNFTTSLRRRYPTSPWSCHIVAMEMSDDIAKTTSLQHLIMTSQNETLQRCRFGNVVWRFHRHYMATSEQRWIAMSQQRCNYVIASTGIVVSNIFSTEKAFSKLAIYSKVCRYWCHCDVFIIISRNMTCLKIQKQSLQGLLWKGCS